MTDYSDLDSAFLPIWRQCHAATMTSVERVYALYKAVEYLSSAQVPGDFVECGVWRGGSMMCAALTLLQLGDTSRSLYLYDTFDGMPPPGPADVNLRGEAASTLLSAQHKSEESAIWAYAPIELVRRNMASTGYPLKQVHLVQGAVEQTIPASSPQLIALLRLDTDWYSSTRWELECLFPRLAPGGVLIIDDYGHWQGARHAVDEYLASTNTRLLLNRIDYTGRIGVRS
ncbi:MAG TPA: TylF/MycF/NovP-related O-methyltransferase [Acetobacteraceae bacterium]